jgi:alkyl sulfatase BDS1-like metallo-beta-lactamase superfamily hydrolase
LAASGSTAATTALCTTICVPSTPRNSACGTATQSRRTPHPPVGSAKRYAQLIGAEAILAEGRRAFEAADYRWAAEILHKLVFADPTNQEARELQADTYEQMGYQAEGPQWRYIYLTAAKELRQGPTPATFSTASPDTIFGMPIEILFDFATVHLIGDKNADVTLQVDFAFTDQEETWTMSIRHGVLNARRGGPTTPSSPCPGPKRPSPACYFGRRQLRNWPKLNRSR